MEPRTLFALALALITLIATVAALLYANRENLAEWRSHRRYDKRRKERLAREASPE